MPPPPNHHEAPDYGERIRAYLPHTPARALELLPLISCDSERRSLASLIVQNWARQDINTAWNSVARSLLSAADKQAMFNEIWG